VAAAPPTPASAPTQSDADRELEALHHTQTAPVPSPAPDTNATASPTIVTDTGTPRIVTREGFVRRAHSIQAPTSFALHDIQDGRLIDYLQPQKGQNFKIFLGTHVTVTGPESMDSRWPSTPVLQVQSVDLIP
jgi:hypothetical protein